MVCLTLRQPASFFWRSVVSIYPEVVIRGLDLPRVIALSGVLICPEARLPFFLPRYFLVICGVDLRKASARARRRPVGRSEAACSLAAGGRNHFQFRTHSLSARWHVLSVVTLQPVRSCGTTACAKLITK